MVEDAGEEVGNPPNEHFLLKFTGPLLVFPVANRGVGVRFGQVAVCSRTW